MIEYSEKVCKDGIFQWFLSKDISLLINGQLARWKSLNAYIVSHLKLVSQLCGTKRTYFSAKWGDKREQKIKEKTE